MRVNCRRKMAVIQYEALTEDRSCAGVVYGVECRALSCRCHTEWYFRSVKQTVTSLMHMIWLTAAPIRARSSKLLQVKVRRDESERRAWSLFTSPPLNPVRPDAAAVGFVLFPFTFFFIMYLLWACDNWKVVNPRRRELSFTLILLC